MPQNNLPTVAPVSPVVVSDLVDLPEQSAPQSAANPLKQMHSIMRGRYWLAAVLALLGAAVGAYFGYHHETPVYRSTGLIRVQPYVPAILYENEQNGLMPMFDTFVGSQMQLMRGQRVISQALLDPDWAALDRGDGPEEMADFRRSLSVSRLGGSELIAVRFTDKDPKAAQVAVKAVVLAFERLYGEEGSQDVNQRLLILEQRMAALAAEHRKITDRILDIAAEYGGASAMEQVYQFKLAELNKLESELRRVELSLALAQSAKASFDVGLLEMDEAQLAGEDSEYLALQLGDLRGLLSRKRDLELQLRIDTTRLGEAHRKIVQMRTTIDAIDDQISELIDRYREMGLLRYGGKTLARLNTEQQYIRPLYETARQETLELAGEIARLERLKADASDTSKRISETKRRLENLQLEQMTGGRLSVESTGEQPLSPLQDKRRKYAAAGGLGMAGLGAALVLLLGLLNRRVRGAADLDEGAARTARLLGILPRLPHDLTDPEQALLAAHGVHQIRALLQGRHRSHPSTVITITGPSPGSGKTSLAVALGLSFASSGSRTLLIDCDLVGGGLTARIGLRQAGSNGSAPAGDLHGALAGQPLEKCLQHTGHSGLDLLPLDSAGHHAGELSPRNLGNILHKARESFDVIILDTGPVLGSIEAAIAAQTSDEVVVTIAHGDTRSCVERCFHLLQAAGAPATGIVLNRAPVRDVLSSSVSRVSRSGSASLPERLPPADRHIRQLGPIGAAVASTAKLPRWQLPVDKSQN